MGTLNRNRLRALMKERGISARALSRAAGLNESGVRDVLSGKSRDPGTATLAAIARALNVGLDELLAGVEVSANTARSLGRPIGRRVPVMGEVAAGLWREASPLHTDDASEFLAIDLPGYENAQLYALKVSGPSMDLVYPPGRYVVVAPAAEAGLRVGDHVIVERYRAGLVEVTIKEIGYDGARVLLIPRSSHPDFQTPIAMSGGDGDQDAPRVIGIVVADFARRDRPPARSSPTSLRLYRWALRCAVFFWRQFAHPHLAPMPTQPAMLTFRTSLGRLRAARTPFLERLFFGQSAGRCGHAPDFPLS